MQGFDQSWLVFACFYLVGVFFPKYNSESIFETDFVVPGGAGGNPQCQSSSRFSWAEKMISPLLCGGPAQAVPLRGFASQRGQRGGGFRAVCH